MTNKGPQTWRRGRTQRPELSCNRQVCTGGPNLDEDGQHPQRLQSRALEDFQCLTQIIEGKQSGLLHIRTLLFHYGKCFHCECAKHITPHRSGHLPAKFSMQERGLNEFTQFRCSCPPTDTERKFLNYHINIQNTSWHVLENVDIDAHVT